ncbi:MAG: chromophore lyase CpcT/CpeT [Rhodospirillaceae bacterium]|nr:chromophore lyase CpcT/CpeT [Rhodospirillaceae bacterium]
MVRILGFAFALTVAGPAAAAPTAQDMAELVRLFTGEFDSHDQYRAEERAGIPESERHTEVYIHNVPVQVPALGAPAFYIEEYRDGDPEKVIRQRVATLEVDAAENAIRMKLYFIKDDKAVRGAHRDPTKLANLTKDNTFLLPGCDILWTRDGDNFNGAMKDSCIFAMKPGDPERRVIYRIVLSELNYLRVDRSVYVTDGKTAGGRADDIPSMHKRVTSLP